MKSLKIYNLCKLEIDCKNCVEIENCEKWRSFVRLHSDTKKYAHFDKRVSLDMETIRKYVMDKEKIASHSFYPFIHFTKKFQGLKRVKKYQQKKESYFIVLI